MAIFVRMGVLAAGIAWTALATSAACAQASARSDAGVDASGAVGDIVVTARKKAESLQQVPTAISALGEDQLRDLQIDNFQDVGKTVPNVFVQKQAGSPTAPQFNIRGISAGSINFQVDSGIALYVDGVYLGRPGNAGFDLADLERLEVARGPQGTLFGRNSTGGAISFITASPTGKLGLIAEGTVGNYARRRGRVTINTPEWNGFSARVTYVHDENIGSVKNSASRRTYNFPAPFGAKTAANTFGASNTESILAALRYRNDSGLTIDYKYDYTDLVTTIDALQLLNAGPTFTAVTRFAEQPALGGTNVVSLTRLGSLPIDSVAPSIQTSWGHNLTATWDVGEHVTLKYIGGYRGFTVNTASELDGNTLFDPAGTGNPYQILAAVRYAHQTQWSHEVQAIGSSPKLDWVIGLFAFREKAELNSPVIFGLVAPTDQTIPITNPGSYLAGGNLLNVLNKSQAAYAHVSFRPIDRVEVGGGIRYSHDDRTENDLLNAPRTPPRGSYTAKQNHVDYDASIKIDLAEHVNIYGKFATGFVSGGIFNSVAFKPETVRSFEVGLKSEWFDRHLRFNVALFDAKRENAQVSGFLVGPGAILVNAGGDHAKGVEIESTFVPLNGLTLTANYGYTDDQTTSGLRTQQPKHTAYLAAQYEASLGGGLTGQFRFDGQYQGKQYRLGCPAGSTASPITGCSNLQDANFALDNALIVPARWNLGARATLADIPVGSAKASISAWVKNLTNKHEYEYLFQVLPLQVLGTFQTPRTFGLDLRLEY